MAPPLALRNVPRCENHYALLFVFENIQNAVSSNVLRDISILRTSISHPAVGDESRRKTKSCMIIVPCCLRLKSVSVVTVLHVAFHVPTTVGFTLFFYVYAGALVQSFVSKQSHSITTRDKETT